MKFLRAIIICLVITLFAGACRGRTNGEEGDSNDPGSAAERETADSISERDDYIFGSDQSDEQVLREAALEGNTDRVEQLISGNTDVNASLPDGRTALMLAAFNGHVPVMDILLNAAAEGHFGVTRVLLEHNADPTIKDKDGDTAESFARRNGHERVAELLSRYQE